MEQNSRIAHFYARWRRITLNTYWLALILSLLGSGFNILLYPIGDVRRQDPSLFLIVTIVQVLTVLAAEVTLRYLQRYFTEAMIVYGAVLAATLCIVNKEPGIMFLLILPILIPTFIAQHNRTLFSLLTALVTYVLLLLFHEGIRMRTSMNEVILLVCVMVSFAFITVGVHKRGSELLNILLSSIREKQEIERIAKQDALTGLSNHRSFHETLDQHIEEYGRAPYPLYLLLFDLDSFKKVNDAFGHLAGDMALRYVSRVLQDVLNENTAAFRYGGEEFAVLISHRSPADVVRIANRLREEIAKQAHPELDGGHVTVSIGVSRYRHGIHKEDLFAEADACLYEAKRTGKNKVIAQMDENGSRFE